MNRQATDEIDRKIQAALNQFSDLKLVLVFGSVHPAKLQLKVIWILLFWLQDLFQSKRKFH